MRAREFIFEKNSHVANPKNMPDDHVSALKGVISMPDLSMNNSGGDQYRAYRFGIAMAGAPDYPTEPVGAMAGDPILTTYTDHDYNIIKSAAKMVDAGRMNKITNNRSHESDDTHKISPVPNWNKDVTQPRKKNKNANK